MRYGWLAKKACPGGARKDMHTVREVGKTSLGRGLGIANTTVGSSGTEEKPGNSPNTQTLHMRQFLILSELGKLVINSSVMIGMRCSY